MRTIEQNTPESKELLAQIRKTLAGELEWQASFRERVADEYPEDERNARSAQALRELADELRINDIYDDTPALRKLLGLVTTYNMELSTGRLVPSDPAESGFNASQYRFHNPNESDDDYLSRLADAVEWEQKDLESYNQ